VDSVNILLVDDQPAKLLGYEAILSDLGERLIKAHSAREALDHLLRNDVAVILVDVCMPELDGFELAQMIRDHPRYKSTAIIFVSAIMMTDFDRLRGYQSGAVDYVSVPVVPEILRAKVTVFADLYRKTKQLEALNRELETRVEERTERLGLALDSAGAASWNWDVRADRLEWTRFSSLYGLPESKAATLAGWLGCMPEEDRQHVAAKLAQVRERAGDDDWKETFRISHGGGGTRVISRLGRAFRDEHGLVCRMTGIDLDVTERVAAEEALKEADRNKDEFLATLAHELRNPLAPIRNALHLMGLEQLSTRQHAESREMVRRQVDHMVRLVDDLLDVSRISSGKIALRLEHVDVAEFVARAVETCQPLLDARGVFLEVRLPSRSIAVRGDATRLVQLLGNILHNAAKYTERGGDVRVLVDQEGEQAVIAVRDNGIGIPPEMLPRIFNLFTQARPSDQRGDGGLGIGLALARRLAQMHHGSLTASSDGAGKGSTFVIRLPLSLGLETPATDHAPPVDAITRKLRILIADDNEDAADSMSLLLAAAGHDVTTVYDGLAAVESAATVRPDTVILDIGMPILDGYGAARRIREEPWGAAVFLIALTGWGQPEDRRHAAEAGFDLHLTKPVDPVRLAAVLADGRPDGRSRG
jgi:signal transduction histidine kinase